MIDNRQHIIDPNSYAATLLKEIERRPAKIVKNTQKTKFKGKEISDDESLDEN